MNDIALLREHGPDAPPPHRDALAAARARLTTEIAETAEISGIAGTAAVRPARPLLTRRRLAVLGTAAVAACAAVVAGIALTGPPATGPTGPAGPITLVAFETPSFPVTLRPEPAGMTVAFNLEPDGHMMAIYRDGTGPDSTGFVVSTGERTAWTEGETVEDVTVGGHAARLVTEPIDWGDGTVGEAVVVTWQRADGGWLTISADTPAYADRDTLLAIAGTVVEEPQPVPLQLRLAPAGWSLFAFKERVLTIVDDADESRTMSIHVPFEPPLPPEELASQVGEATGPVRAVTVHGRDAHLVPTAMGWYLQAAFPDGTSFVLQAPSSFTADDVVTIASEATYDTSP